MGRDVFISYRNEDRDAANQICKHLEQNGISCWIAPRNIPPGEEWAAAITGALRSCRALVLLLSSHSKNSKQIAREVQLADRNGLTIVTFRLDDVDPPPNLEYFLANLQWIDGFGGQFEPALNSVAETVRQTISAFSPTAEAGTATAEKASATTPIPSPQPMTASATPHRSSPAFDNAELDRLKRALAVHMGAMSRIIVDRAAQSATSWDQLYKSLAAEIPEGEERKRFLANRQH